MLLVRQSPGLSRRNFLSKSIPNPSQIRPSEPRALQSEFVKQFNTKRPSMSRKHQEKQKTKESNLNVEKTTVQKQKNKIFGELGGRLALFSFFLTPPFNSLNIVFFVFTMVFSTLRFDSFGFFGFFGFS